MKNPAVCVLGVALCVLGGGCASARSEYKAAGGAKPVPASAPTSARDVAARLARNPVKQLTDHWHQRALQPDYRPSTPLEQLYQDYLEQLGSECATLAAKNIGSPADVMLVVKNRLSSRREILMKAFADAGYAADDVEWCIAFIHVSIEKDELPRLLKEYGHPSA